MLESAAQRISVRQVQWAKNGPAVLFWRYIVLISLVIGGSPASTHAQGLLPSGDSSNDAWADIVPLPPTLPEVVARDEAGRVTLRAVRVEEAVSLDGKLDDDVYTRVKAITGFVQQEPHGGQSSTEDAHLWVLFDDRNLYVSARLFQDPSQIVATEMRRDNTNLNKDDNLAVILDTFRDHRSGFFFYVSAAGGMFDGHVTDESQNNREWNTVWDARTDRFAEGWTLEMAIPFRSLRYAPGRDQIWGINFRRIMTAKNELATLSPVPASYGNPGVMRVSLAATLVGIEVPSVGLGLDVKPYMLANVTTDRTISPAVSDDPSGEVGFDVKYGITRGMTFDFTYNTDFAQVEDDQQQVNLTRFSLFFPERRDFFLEGQGIFGFGGVRTSGNNANSALTPVLFFSRRIGLSEGRPIPIQAGGRLTGRSGPYTIGAVNIQTGDEPRFGATSTNFSVVRVRRDILRRSTIGIMATNRSVSLAGDGSNQTFGVDAMLPLHEEMVINSFYATTRTPGLSGGESSYRAQLDYPADRYGIQLEHMTVGRNFNPEVGFLRRRDFRRNYAELRFSPRPKAIEAIRKVSWQGSFDYITDTNGRLETRESKLLFETNFNSSDVASVEYVRGFEFIPEPFEISKGVIVPVAAYSTNWMNTKYELGPQRLLSGSIVFNRGGFLSGDRTEVGYNGRVAVNSRLTFEPNVSINWVDLAEGSFTTQLISTRTNVTFTPRMLVGALIQYNSSASTFSTNIRFHWEYRPGSDLYVVYGDGRETFDRGFRNLLNRTFAVKLTRLLRF